MWVLCVLSGRGLCDELITRPQESYRLWCVVECDLETSWMRRPWLTGGCRAKNLHSYITTHLGVPSGLVHSGFPNKTLSTSLLSCHMPGQSRPSWFDQPNIIRWAVRIITVSFMQSHPAPCRFFPIRSKHLSQHHVLEHPHPMFLAQYKGPILIPIHNNRQNYSSAYFNLFLYQLNYTGY